MKNLRPPKTLDPNAPDAAKAAFVEGTLIGQQKRLILSTAIPTGGVIAHARIF
jgi:hypothetical protein